MPCYVHLERQLELLTASASGSGLREDADQRVGSVFLQIKLGLEFLCRDEKAVLLGLALLVGGDPSDHTAECPITACTHLQERWGALGTRFTRRQNRGAEVGVGR